MYNQQDIFRHRSTEELRDMLGVLKNDTQSLSNYGELGDSVAMFYSLSLEDRLTLLYLSLTEGDQDVQKVGRCLMGTLAVRPALKGPEDLLARMTARTRSELTRLKEATETTLKESDRVAITGQLKRACGRIGSLHIEEAFWILIPGRSGEGATWIEASGRGNDRLPGQKLVFDSKVVFGLTEQERSNLLTAIERSRWALHIHNHPVSLSPMYVSLCAPSGTDEQTASRWRSIKPGLGHKMKFFVAQNDKAVEYALPRNRLERWL